MQYTINGIPGEWTIVFDVATRLKSTVQFIERNRDITHEQTQYCVTLCHGQDQASPSNIRFRFFSRDEPKLEALQFIYAALEAEVVAVDNRLESFIQQLTVLFPYLPGLGDRTEKLVADNVAKTDLRCANHEDRLLEIESRLNETESRLAVLDLRTLDKKSKRK